MWFTAPGAPWRQADILLAKGLSSPMAWNWSQKQAQKQVNALRTDLGWLSQSEIVISIGHIKEAKDYGAAIRAFALAAAGGTCTI